MGCRGGCSCALGRTPAPRTPKLSELPLAPKAWSGARVCGRSPVSAETLDSNLIYSIMFFQDKLEKCADVKLPSARLKLHSNHSNCRERPTEFFFLRRTLSLVLFRTLACGENKKPAGPWVGFMIVFKLPLNNPSHCAPGWTSPIATPLICYRLSFLPV